MLSEGGSVDKKLMLTILVATIKNKIVFYPGPPPKLNLINTFSVYVSERKAAKKVFQDEKREEMLRKLQKIEDDFVDKEMNFYEDAKNEQNKRLRVEQLYKGKD